MSLEVVPVDKPADMNVVIGQAHFIKAIDDLHEALAGVSPHLRFGVAFCEASSARLVRRSGNDEGLTGLAAANALAIGAGHAFVILLREGFPVNVLNPLKAVPEVCTIFCATANPVDVIVAAAWPRPWDHRRDRRGAPGRHRAGVRRHRTAGPAPHPRLQALSSQNRIGPDGGRGPGASRPGSST